MDEDFTTIQFSVVKYVPDPMRDEPVNVGIVCQHDGRTVLRTVSTFSRVRKLAGVKSTDALETGLRFLRSALDRTPDVSLADLVERPMGIIRFSDVMGGVTLEPEFFIDEQFDVYVGENITTRSTPAVDRKFIREELRHTMAGLGVDASRYAIFRSNVRGRTAPHAFDFGFENGHVSLWRALSLQTNSSYFLTEAKEICFSALDTRELAYEVVAVVAPPADNETTAHRAVEAALSTLRQNVSKVILIDNPDLRTALAAIAEDHQLRPVRRELLVADPVLA